MKQWNRFFYTPVLPMGKDGTRVTGSREHIGLSRSAASEGMVLLKNENQVLPFSYGKRVAVFGKGGADYVKGGGGSGDVTIAYSRSLLDGLEEKAKEGKLELFEPLNTFYREDVTRQYREGIVPGMTIEPKLPEELLKRAGGFADTAILTFCRFSGENWDRTPEGEAPVSEFQKEDNWLLDRSAKVFQRGDFYLSDEEEALLCQVKQTFKHIVVVLNVGGVVDTSWFVNEPAIESVLLAWQGGMEGGLAAADLLCGDQNPSGRLVDTFAAKLADYPSSEGFHDSFDYVKYTEDIYVGYRYFETIPDKKSRVNYPFGYGLSYTSFRSELLSVCEEQEEICFSVRITNTGCRSGKETTAIYVSAPQGKLGKPMRELKAFQKTRMLLSGEAQEITMKVKKDALASFDDLGKVKKSAYVLEAGAYEFFLGANVREAKKIDYCFMVSEDCVVEQCEAKCTPSKLEKRLLSDGTMEELPTFEKAEGISEWPGAKIAGCYDPDTVFHKGRWFRMPLKSDGRKILEEVSDGMVSMDEFVAQLSVDEKIGLCCGQQNTGIANTFGFGNIPDYGVPNVMTADGPAGLRIYPGLEVYTTAFPCATLLACTWNPDLLEQVGAAGALEVLENNIAVWLTPAMNIHRSPLCGRNFEYYSEDPLISGKMGAAMVRGIQSRKVAASVKHFCCNNKETCRFESDSRLSERALREIYLKGFEIVVKEADPWTIMTSYNVLNGTRTSENKELLNDILRKEWGFEGMLTTDWWNHADQVAEIKAGNDVKMGCGFPAMVRAAFDRGEISEEEITVCAKRVLAMICKLA